MPAVVRGPLSLERKYSDENQVKQGFNPNARERDPYQRTDKKDDVIVMQRYSQISKLFKDSQNVHEFEQRQKIINAFKNRS